jgi:uncharacterized protein
MSIVTKCRQERPAAGSRGQGEHGMIISDLTAKECRQLLAQSNFGRLACARDNQPYIVPIYFAYEPDRLYAFATKGRKIEWMRANPLVCVQIDDVQSHYEWTSVIVNGRYEEFPDTLEYSQSRSEAQYQLEKRELWWQTAYVAQRRREEPAGFNTPIFYCIHIEELTGLCATADRNDKPDGPAKPSPK